MVAAVVLSCVNLAWLENAALMHNHVLLALLHEYEYCMCTITALDVIFLCCC
jgi:hypothetical protein